MPARAQLRREQLVYGPALDLGRPVAAAEVRQRRGRLSIELPVESRDERLGDIVDDRNAARRAGKTEPEVVYLLVKAYRNAGQPEAGIRAFSELASTFPESAFVHQLLGEAYELTENPEAAENEFRRAIEKAPEQPELHFALGYFCWKQRRYGEARAYFERELRITRVRPARFTISAISR